ncbi:MAG: hypothetical protein QNK04_27570 [Myxococcota bacterium]|nr:hypothetical protein [Myxococcota bacterium]
MGIRSYQIFASMSPEQAQDVMQALADQSPPIFAQAVAAAGAALKARPVYLQRQPFAKRAEAVRRALSRVASNPVAAEILAVYFLECRKQLLVAWLDALGLEHEDGTLRADAPPEPPEAELRATIDKFLSTDGDPDRPLLLAAFAAQDAIEWPVLEAALGERSADR